MYFKHLLSKTINNGGLRTINFSQYKKQCIYVNFGVIAHSIRLAVDIEFYVYAEKFSCCIFWAVNFASYLIKLFTVIEQSTIKSP